MGFLQHGPWGMAWLRPEQLLGLQGLDGLTHSLFWSLLANVAPTCRGVAVARAFGPRGQPGLLFVDVFERTATSSPVFWRGRANTPDLLRLCERFLGGAKAQALFDGYAQRVGVPWWRSARRPAGAVCRNPAGRRRGQRVGPGAGGLGGRRRNALARRRAAHSGRGLAAARLFARAGGQVALAGAATAELRAANEQLKSLDRLKDDFMSSVTHELRTPLTSSARWPN
jgi:signal transduction histidine kinase